MYGKSQALAFVKLDSSGLIPTRIQRRESTSAREREM